MNWLQRYLAGRVLKSIEKEAQMMPKSWRTTLWGVGVILVVVGNAVISLFDDNGVTKIDLALLLAGLQQGFGLISARDQKAHEEGTMKRLYLLLLVAIICSAYPLRAQNLEDKHRQMLYPTVRVRAGDIGGSGTVVYSKKDAKGEWHTFVMTNHHVIGNLIEVKEQWDSVLKKTAKKETTKTAQVEFFRYNNLSHVIGSFAVEADVVAYDPPQDWALLELRDKENGAEAIAGLFPKDKIESEIHVGDEVFAVGASLGHAPIMTFGHITFMDDEIDNFKYFMSTAQIIFGNSGGAVFRYSHERKRYEFIGIPSRLSVSGGGFSETPITHMGYFIPINRIYDLLDSQIFRFIYDSKVALEANEKERKDKREKARLASEIPH